MRLLSTKLVASILIVAVVSVARAQDLAGPLGAAPAAQRPATAVHKRQKAKRPAPIAKSSAGAPQTQPQPVDSQAAQAPPPVLHGTNGPDDGPSLDLKWHATNDKVDPYDAVSHTAGPYGQGVGLQGGVKFGF